MSFVARLSAVRPRFHAISGFQMEVNVRPVMEGVEVAALSSAMRSGPPFIPENSETTDHYFRLAVLIFTQTF